MDEDMAMDREQSVRYAEKMKALEKMKAAREKMKAERDQRPGLSNTADQMHRAMADLAEQLEDVETTLRPVLRQDNTPTLSRLLEDPDTREGQSEVHGIVRQWLDQVQSMTSHLKDLTGRVDL